MKRAPLFGQLKVDDGQVQAFKALAHHGRLEVFFHLVKAGREVAAGDIQDALGLPGPTLSHHLDQLRRAGLLQSRRKQRHILYAVNRALVTDLVRLMTACC